MEKVWFKLRQTDYPPSPEDAILRGDGDDSTAPLCLGHLVSNLKALDFPLNHGSILPFPSRMRVFGNSTLNFTWDDTRLRSPGTNLAATGVTAKASLQFAFMKTVESHEEYDRLDTYIVQPTKGYIEDCLERDQLKAYVKGKVSWSMFMITGIKVARAGKREAQEETNLAADIGPELDLPSQVSAEHPGDFIWAIRLAKIHKGLLMKDWSVDPHTKRATFAAGDESELIVEGVLRNEGLEGFTVVEDDKLDEVIILDGSSRN
ncbi:hypothetical protein FACUT_7406 [Fusarium acutatum]|uniref:Uncharacterized protein n=1 Tax=Fusarium acutatum TaxID=78861 RepID=A0A8H4NHE1_9HYPO|nr:hypothetical protein FACUT_7406 [Fusarium acutatum]